MIIPIFNIQLVGLMLSENIKNYSALLLRFPMKKTYLNWLKQGSDFIQISMFNININIRDRKIYK